jgi:hypothetical protein
VRRRRIGFIQLLRWRWMEILEIHVCKSCFLFLGLNWLLSNWREKSGLWTKWMKNGKRIWIDKFYVVIVFANPLHSCLLFWCLCNRVNYSDVKEHKLAKHLRVISKSSYVFKQKILLFVYTGDRTLHAESRFRLFYSRVWSKNP